MIYRGNYIYKSTIDVALYQQVLSRASEDPRAVPVLCCFDEFYVLARDHQYHDELSVYYNTINYVDTFEGLDVDSNKISIFFPAYDAEPAFREDYNPAFSDQLYVTNAGREWIDFMNLGVDKFGRRAPVRATRHRYRRCRRRGRYLQRHPHVGARRA